MSTTKRLLFSLLTIVLILALIEGAARIVWWYLAAQGKRPVNPLCLRTAVRANVH